MRKADVVRFVQDSKTHTVLATQKQVSTEFVCALLDTIISRIEMINA